MDDVKFDRMETKLDRISERINSIDVTLASQHESLREHIRRTSILEEEIKPLKNHVLMAAGAAKIIGLMVGAVGLCAAVFEILTYFRK